METLFLPGVGMYIGAFRTYMESLVINIAELADAGVLLKLEREAYQQEAALYQDWSIAPLRETLEELTACFSGQVILKARLTPDGPIVGSVRLHLEGTTVRIGRLIVSPELQRRGFGRALIQAAEVHFPQAQRLELFTGDKSAGNLAFYDRLGFKPFRKQRMSDKVTLVYLEKSLGTPFPQRISSEIPSHRSENDV
jgi:ribosomal protein S18 acetylase RimI-like enzyme